MDRIDPAFFDEEQVRAALSVRDIGALYRLLRRVGVSQRRIGQLTDQSQSEVCEILNKGRRVRDVGVLERIADGLGIPRERLGVSYGEQSPEAPSGEEDEDVIRRNLITLTTAVALRHGLPGLGEPIEPALLNRQPLPARLSMVHVQIVRSATEQLRGMGRRYGGQADAFVEAAARYARWMQVPASEAVQTQLAAALAELYTQAGWACYDSGMTGTACFTSALRLAGVAEDTYGVAHAAWRAGLTLVRNGHPNDALKLFQLGQFHLRLFPPRQSSIVPADDSRLVTLTARLNLNSATAYAVMQGSDQAERCLAEAQEGWTPQDALEQASMDRGAAVIQLDLGRLEAAEQFAARAVHGYGKGDRLGRVQAELLLAEVNVRAGESRGLPLAHHAISQVSTLQSVAIRRQRLMPLATALAARPGNDTRQLAKMARRVATTPI